MSSWRVHGLSEGSSCHSVPVLVPRANVDLMLPELQFSREAGKIWIFWKSLCVLKLDLIILKYSTDQI